MNSFIRSLMSGLYIFDWFDDLEELRDIIVDEDDDYISMLYEIEEDDDFISELNETDKEELVNFIYEIEEDDLL